MGLPLGMSPVDRNVLCFMLAMAAQRAHHTQKAAVRTPAAASLHPTCCRVLSPQSPPAARSTQLGVAHRSLTFPGAAVIAKVRSARPAGAGEHGTRQMLELLGEGMLVSGRCCSSSRHYSQRN